MTARQLAAADLRDGLWQWRLWGTLGWNDIQQRYRRSALGPFWITLSVTIFISALGVLYSTLFKVAIAEYMPFVTAGYLVWSLIAATVSDSCIVFIEAESIIKQVRLPLSVFVYRLVWRNLLILAHHLPVLAVVWLVFGVAPGWSLLLAPIGLLLICINAVWVGLLLGLLCTRFRDVSPIVASLMQVIFFVTPVFWSPTLLGDRAFLANANVIYHFIEIVRAPLLGQPPSLLSIGAVGLTTVVGWIVGAALFRRFRNRIAYWL